jgi:hypothetical protein
MAVRVFKDRGGNDWSVWLVQPTSSTAGLQERFQKGWLCFERQDGHGRARLPMDEAPPGWEQLPDDRLELLCRVAEVSSGLRSVTPTGAHSAQKGDEDEARQRRSGPRHLTGTDEAR